MFLIRMGVPEMEEYSGPMGQGKEKLLLLQLNLIQMINQMRTTLSLCHPWEKY